MLVAVCKIELFLPESDSLKSKRFVISSIKKRVRNKFNVSISEIDNNDKWQRATFGISMVTNERKFIDSTMQEIFKLINFDGRMEIINHSIEMY